MTKKLPRRRPKKVGVALIPPFPIAPSRRPVFRDDEERLATDEERADWAAEDAHDFAKEGGWEP